MELMYMNADQDRRRERRQRVKQPGASTVKGRWGYGVLFCSRVKGRWGYGVLFCFRLVQFTNKCLLPSLGDMMDQRWT